jgi:hypothetical protein
LSRSKSTSAIDELDCFFYAFNDYLFSQRYHNFINARAYCFSRQCDPEGLGNHLETYAPFSGDGAEKIFHAFLRKIRERRKPLGYGSQMTRNLMI